MVSREDHSQQTVQIFAVICMIRKVILRLMYVIIFLNQPSNKTMLQTIIDELLSGVDNSQLNLDEI